MIPGRKFFELAVAFGTIAAFAALARTVAPDAADLLSAAAATETAPGGAAQGAGETTVKELRDNPQAPAMIVIPAGSFSMGSVPSEAGRSTFEDPQHPVTISRAFALGKYDVTFEQWDICVADGGCNGYSPSDEGWGRDSQPVVNVSEEDAQAYVDWLSRKTGQHYRLPTEAEWEYAARGGTSGPYWWGDAASHDHANYGADVCCSGLAEGADRWQASSPVGSFAPNPFGLFDMNGNVMQYVADCWHGSYRGAPADGSAWGQGACGMYTTRGGSWSSPPAFIRASDRIFIPAGSRINFLGFRVARDLPPTDAQTGGSGNPPAPSAH